MNKRLIASIALLIWGNAQALQNTIPALQKQTALLEKKYEETQKTFTMFQQLPNPRPQLHALSQATDAITTLVANTLKIASTIRVRANQESAKKQLVERLQTLNNKFIELNNEIRKGLRGPKKPMQTKPAPTIPHAPPVMPTKPVGPEIPPAPPVMPRTPLRPAQPTPKKPTPAGPAETSRTELLGEIRAGKQLKPVSAAELEAERKRKQESMKSETQKMLEKGFKKTRLPEFEETEEVEGVWDNEE